MKEAQAVERRKLCKDPLQVAVGSGVEAAKAGAPQRIRVKLLPSIGGVKPAVPIGGTADTEARWGRRRGISGRSLGTAVRVGGWAVAAEGGILGLVVVATTGRSRRERSGNGRRQVRRNVGKRDSNEVVVSGVATKEVDTTARRLAFDKGEVVLEGRHTKVSLVDTDRGKLKAVEEEVGAKDSEVSSERDGGAVRLECSTSNEGVEGAVAGIRGGREGVEVVGKGGVGLHITNSQSTTLVSVDG